GVICDGLMGVQARRTITVAASDVALQLDTPKGATEVPGEPAVGKVAREKRAAVRKKESHRSDLSRRPLDYESRALPLSYGGAVPNLATCCSTRYSTASRLAGSERPRDVRATICHSVAAVPSLGHCSPRWS